MITQNSVGEKSGECQPHPERASESLKKLREANIASAIVHWRNEYGRSDAPGQLEGRIKAFGERTLGEQVAGLPPRYTKWRLGDYPETWQKRAADFLSNRHCWSLYLHGHVGTHKTSFAVAVFVVWRQSLPWNIKDSFFLQPAEGLFLPPYEVAAVLRDFEYGRHAIGKWQEADLLVLDDLGASRNTPHVTEQLLYLLEKRYDYNRKTILTSNFNLAQLAEHLDRRVSSRLQEGMLLDLGETDSRAADERRRR